MNKIDVFIYTIQKLPNSTIDINNFLKNFGDVPNFKKNYNNENKDLFLCCLKQEKSFVETICNKHHYNLYNMSNMIEFDEDKFNNKYTLMIDYLNRTYYLDKLFSHIGSYNGYKLNDDGYPIDKNGVLVEGIIPYWHS